MKTLFIILFLFCSYILAFLCGVDYEIQSQVATISDCTLNFDNAVSGWERANSTLEQCIDELKVYKKPKEKKESI